MSPVGNFLPVMLVVSSFLILGAIPPPIGVTGILFVVAGVYYSSVSGKHGLLHPLKQIIKNRGSRAMLTWAILMGVSTISVFSSLSVFFQFQAMNMGEASYVLSMKRLDVLLTVLLAGLFLKERHILRRFKGSAIAIAGVVILLVAT